MSNHFGKGSSDNNPHQNPDGADHNNPKQNSTSGGFPSYQSWLRAMGGNSYNKNDTAIASTESIDKNILQQFSSSELSNPSPDGSTKKTAEEILKDVQTKNETTAQNTSTDYTTLFIDSMKNFDL